jgi:hypothetical protein
MNCMYPFSLTPFLIALALPFMTGCEGQAGEPELAVSPPRDAPELAEPARPEPVSAAPLPGPSAAEVAEAAWAFIDRNWHDATGLVSATDHYAVVTTWDMGSMLAALYSAHGLGLIEEAEYDRRMARLLETLATVDLYDGVAFNKAYDSRTGRMVDRRDRPSAQGYGWSVLDLGRLLSWLRIVHQQTPRHASAARGVVQRLDFGALVEDGYLIGGNLERGRTVTYVEGRIGYEQYAAEAFARWGHEAPLSASLTENTEPVNVNGYAVLADTRGRDRLTSEPFVLLGLELGWSDEMRPLASNVLGAQRARYESTGTVTVVSEDAMTEPPHYFYYYSLLLNGQTFVVDAQGARQAMDGPRWVSAKATYGWHALLPDDYTALAVAAVAPAVVPGQAVYSGVYEEDGRRAGSANVNTAGVILQTLLFREGGLPLIGD